MFQISRRTPAYFLTSVAHHRLPIFQTDRIKQVVAAAFDEARRSAGFKIFAFVIMLDHYHLISDSSRTSSDTIRYLNGITAKRVLDHLKENNYESSLAKLRREDGDRNHRYSLFEHHPNILDVYSEQMFMQKLNYIHLNPVNERLVEHPDEYLYSSARQWHGKRTDEEPLLTDHREIKWRPAA